MRSRLALLLLVACGGEESTQTRSVVTPAQEPAAPSPAQDETNEPLPTPAPVVGRQVNEGEVSELSRGIDALGVDLYAQVREREGNLAFSPASILMAFDMTRAGAAGETRAQMSRTLHLDNVDSPPLARRLLEHWALERELGVELDVANRLFGDDATTFEGPFLQVTGEQYAAELEERPFRTAPDAQRVHINRWVHTQTRERISDLLPEGSISADTRLVLVNAIAFLGQWSHAFQTFDTRPTTFHQSGGTMQTPMMQQTEHFKYARLSDVSVIQLPYGNGDEFAMVIYLPRSRDGLGALESALSVEQMREWREAMRFREVELMLPRFTIDNAQLDLKSLMTNLGMRDAFTRGSADFTAMSNPSDPEERLFISDAFHQAFVRVDERGTEAAAATAVVMGALGGMPMDAPPTFRADHPFIFELRDLRADSSLFLGRVVQPDGV